MMQQARPPYVRFEIQEEEDRTASIEAGHYVSKEVVVVKVTQIGSSDTYVNNADEWLATAKRDAFSEPPRLPREWFEQWKTALERFKSNQEAPLHGTSIRSWPVASKGQVEALINMGCLTVEDLAALTEDGIGRLGMGARALKDKAVKWLEESSSVGKVASQNVALEEQNRLLSERLASLEKQLSALSAPKTLGKA